MWRDGTVVGARLLHGAGTVDPVLCGSLEDTNSDLSGAAVDEQLNARDVACAV
jgi:hypothetical protein